MVKKSYRDVVIDSDNKSADSELYTVSKNLGGNVPHSPTTNQLYASWVDLKNPPPNNNKRSPKELKKWASTKCPSGHFCVDGCYFVDSKVSY
eukprot:scaffold5818_cov70-Attheya_sp.AAC.1